MMGFSPFDHLPDYVKGKGNTVIGWLFYPILAPLILLFLGYGCFSLWIWKVIQKAKRKGNDHDKSDDSATGIH